MSQSALEGGEGEGGRGQAVGRRVEVGVHLHCVRAASTSLERVTQATALCSHWEGHKIGCADSDSGIAVEGAPNAKL